MNIPQTKKLHEILLTGRNEGRNSMIKKKFSLIQTTLSIALLLMISTSVWAETVILRNHQVLHGRVTFQDVNILRMKDDAGVIQEIDKNEILKVSYRDVKDEKEIRQIIEEEEKKIPVPKRKKAVTVSKPQANAEKRSKWSIVWRSALLPGWGQWKAEKKLYATLAIGGTLLATGYAISKVSEFQSAESSYESKTQIVGLLTLGGARISGSPFAGQSGIFLSIYFANSFFQPYSRAQVDGNNAIQTLAVVYMAQLFHSFMIGNAWEKETPNTSIGKKAAFGDWNFNAQPRHALSPAGISRETYYEVNYRFQF